MYSGNIQELKGLVDALVRQTPGVEAVYLFGSRIDGNKPSQKSDIDIAFLFDRILYKTDPLEAFFSCQMIGAKISEFYSEPVDLSLLNEASLPFAYEVITSGSCLYEKDHTGRVLYEIAVKGRFFDFKPFIAQLRNKKLKTLAGTV